jgi:S1-C subfamily serine protease
MTSPILRIAQVSLTVAALCCGAAFAQPAETSASQNASVPTQNSIKLIRVIAALPAGAPWLKLSTDSRGGGLLQSFLCMNDGVTQTWNGGRQDQELAPFAVAFKTELDRAGYKTITPGEDNLFDQQSGAADLQVAAVITDMQIDGCMSRGSLFTSRGDIRGNSVMKVDWQVYSPISKQVVARLSTSATAKLEHSVPGGVQRLVSESFAANVDQLASNMDFRAALSAPRALAKGFVMPGQQSKIILAGSLKAAKRPVADAVASVATILTSSGSGSADLVSNDGYMLTNAHVVGDEKQVRVRWSDGIETVAEVVRVAKDRDVALIKTNPRDREPLPIKRGPVTPGARVYAIGSPLGKEYQGTLSSGIISATRVMEGMRYIQSDVAVTHGSSGGALLDENGAMIGITVSGIDRAPGLNFFIPIGDVMDFLSLEQQ